MPKRPREKFYAVLNGRGGPRVYCQWHEYRKATLNYSGASGKSFLSYEDAQKWLEDAGVGRRHQEDQDMDQCGEHTQSYPQSLKYWAEYNKPPPEYKNAAVQCSEVMLYAEMQNAGLMTPQCFPSVPEASPVEVNPTECGNVNLSSEQRRVLELVKSGQNVFFTGPAGTGKSVLLRAIISELKKTKSIAITASTGIAGLNIGGTTIHSFAGIGLGKEPTNTLARKIKYSKRLAERWISTNVLIVDEISMMDATLFDKLEHIARIVRDSSEPFGGIQLVLSGDFFQLPPVPDQSYNYKMSATYAFDADSWSRCIAKPIFLSQVFRQKDNTFVDILASMRTGVLTSEYIKQIQQLSRPLHYADGIEPSWLFPLRREVESCNNARLSALHGPVYTYNSVDSRGYDVRKERISSKSANLLLDRLIAVSTITLKVGAQVMLIQNIEQGVLVNGSVGKVVEFLTTGEAIQRHISIASISKSNQSDDLDPKIPPSASLKPLNGNKFDLKDRWPMVRFTNGRELLCAPLAFTVEGFMGNVEAHRLQVPLILAWALSIHKSQGQTLTRVKVDLGQVFEKGQAYVALSRATTMEHLEVQNFEPSKVLAHPHVLRWQKYWVSTIEDDSYYDEMDTDEAILQYCGDSLDLI